MITAIFIYQNVPYLKEPVPILINFLFLLSLIISLGDCKQYHFFSVTISKYLPLLLRDPQS